MTNDYLLRLVEELSRNPIKEQLLVRLSMIRTAHCKYLGGDCPCSISCQAKQAILQLRVVDQLEEIKLQLKTDSGGQ